MSGPKTPSRAIDVTELTVQSARQGLANGLFTSCDLVEAHWRRIEAFNPGYRAIITPNPQVLRDAEEIDRRRAGGDVLGPLAGIPIVVKDTIDMAGLPTTAGWAPLSARAGGTDLIPETDSPVVERMRRAGALILGKTNVPPFSVSAEHTNDSWAGSTYNAAAPTRVPGGSSAGTATAIAACFAVVGLAEETGGSIQNPAVVQGLVGIKPTFALVPNTGVVPLGGSTRDAVGPIARTVRDAAWVLDAIAGYTPRDPKTVAAYGHLPEGGYTSSLATATLSGQRLGLYGPGWRHAPLREDTRALYEATIATVTGCGATGVPDPFAGSGFAELARTSGPWDYDQRGEESSAYDLECYLARLGPRAPVRSLADLTRLTGRDVFAETGPLAYQRSQAEFLASLADLTKPPPLENFRRLREQYIALFDAVMERYELDALMFPHSIAEAPLLHEAAFIIPTTVSAVNIGGFPAVNVPAARYPSGTPFGVVLVGRLWDERKLLALAHAFEAAVQGYRRAELIPQPAAARRSP